MIKHDNENVNDDKYTGRSSSVKSDDKIEQIFLFLSYTRSPFNYQSNVLINRNVFLNSHLQGKFWQILSTTSFRLSVTC